MKYTLATVLTFAIFCGVPACLQPEGRRHIVSRTRLIEETISTAWHRPALEKRAIAGARILRDIYVITPSQRLRFESVVASRDDDVCYFLRAQDARGSSLAYAFFDPDEDRVRYGLEFREINGQCDGKGSIDLTASVVGIYERIAVQQ
jgi:hypothetical protein